MDEEQKPMGDDQTQGQDEEDQDQTPPATGDEGETGGESVEEGDEEKPEDTTETAV